ncbi:FAD-binding protein [Acidianus sulfidivorans JP7]|uniref:FAD-binding PCMH-type domain-containing protein n=1 Tax=Acidianus sulfidivorans JP7 TaxID=619593 RepID=A0A2U9IPT0_9CREN|nr:FAD-binding oxidoreductase [Acidianus sulfidivorans]AWR98040.1 FAD-binding protein [Acidianus sulfidivorans JP7]
MAVLCKELVYPKTYEELQEIVKDSIGKRKIYVMGFNTNHIGKDVSADLCVSTKNFNKILDVSEADLYVTVQAGVSFQNLNNELSKRGLFLPLTYSGSMGGLASTNFPSLFSVIYPYPKDLLLGSKIITGLGELINSGSKMPKFSSGYKIWKVLSGSLGWLGIYVELTFRLIGKPEIIAFSEISPHKINNILKERPWGIIFSKGKTYVIFAGFSKFLKKLEETYDLSFQEGLPDVSLDCEKIYGITTFRGKELEIINKLDSEKTIGYIGSGYIRTCNANRSELKDETVVIEKGCLQNEECFEHYETGELLKKALDPYNVFISGH